MTTNGEIFANVTLSTIAGGAGGAGTSLGASDTSLLLASGAGALYPALSGGQFFRMLLGAVSGTFELVKVTARAGDTLTIVRAQEGTSTITWPVGTPVAAAFTAASGQAIWDRIHAYTLNVRDWGAVADGATDDTLALDAAISAMPAGSSLYFPAGTGPYMISAPLSFTSGNTYYGDSDQTWIKQVNGANLNCLAANYEYLHNVTLAGAPTFVHDLGFDGNYANNTSGHGFVLQAWQSVVRQCWFKNIPQTAVVVADRTIGGTSAYNVTNSIVENKLYDLKIANCNQYGIWVQDNNGQCTDGRIENCDINTTLSTGMLIERAAGWYIAWNHCYSIKGNGYVLDKCFATWFIGNQIADFGNTASATGTMEGVSCTLIEGYPTVIADNIIMCSEASTTATYIYLTVTCDGYSAATYGTFGIVHDNQIRGAWPNATHGVDSIGMNFGATTQQQTNGQPAGLLIHANHADRVHTEYIMGSYILANLLNNHVFGAQQVDGDLTWGGHFYSTSPGGLTIAAGGSAGASPPAPNVLAAHDERGHVQFGTGTTPVAGNMVSVTFNKPFTSTPFVLVSAGNAATAALQLFANSVSTTGFHLSCGVAPAASQANTTYDFTWMAIG